MKRLTKEDMVGKKFGMLLVIDEAGVMNGCTSWLCKCECGQVKVLSCGSLRSGQIKSCGCLQKKSIKESNKKKIVHGMCDTHSYRVWRQIKDRCRNTRNKSYSDYGGRGICICDEWRDDFMSFYKYVSNLPNFEEVGYTLDRINNDGNYEPGNLRWSTRKEQANNRRTCRILEAFGEKHTVSEWSDILGISDKTIRSRLHRGKNVAESLRVVGGKNCV